MPMIMRSTRYVKAILIEHAFNHDSLEVIKLHMIIDIKDMEIMIKSNDC